MSLDDWLQSGKWATGGTSGLGEAAGKALERMGGAYEGGRRTARSAKTEGKKRLDEAAEKYGVSDRVDAVRERAEAARERASAAAERALRFVRERPAARIARAGVQIKAGLTGFGAGYLFPDIEVLFLGVGGRGRWITQSGIPVWGAEKLARALLLERGLSEAGGTGEASKVRRELYGAVAAPLLAGFSTGLGVRLVQDAINVRGIPDIGRIIVGGQAAIWERAWMLGNGVWCFLMGKDLLLVTLGRTPNQSLSEVLRRLREEVQAGPPEEDEEPV